MIYKLYNELKQPLIHRGQLNLGDIVHFSGAYLYKVIKLKGDTGVIKSHADTYPIEFIKGEGWVYGT